MEEVTRVESGTKVHSSVNDHLIGYLVHYIAQS
jgi:hypothetical protein